jgi:hypothetical protein
MGLMDKLITSTVLAPPKLIVYGPPGIGKTTFGASAGALLVDCENGAGNIPGLTRTPYLQTWNEMRGWLVDLATTPPPGLAAVAVDTVDWMIQRIVEHVVVDLDAKSPSNITNTLGSSHGGYYKAREIVQNIVYRELLPMLNAITERGAAVILLAHAANTKMTTPEGYDLRLAAPDLPQWLAPPFIEWADGVFYATRNGDERVMKTESTNVILAKNRYSLPPELPLSWPALMAGIVNSKPSEQGA